MSEDMTNRTIIPASSIRTIDGERFFSFTLPKGPTYRDVYVDIGKNSKITLERLFRFVFWGFPPAVGANKKELVDAISELIRFEGIDTQPNNFNTLFDLKEMGRQAVTDMGDLLSSIRKIDAQIDESFSKGIIRDMNEIFDECEDLYEKVCQVDIHVNSEQYVYVVALRADQDRLNRAFGVYRTLEEAKRSIANDVYIRPECANIFLTKIGAASRWTALPIEK